MYKINIYLASKHAINKFLIFNYIFSEMQILIHLTKEVKQIFFYPIHLKPNLLKLSMNANNLKAQIFHKIKYDHKGY